MSTTSPQNMSWRLTNGLGFPALHSVAPRSFEPNAMHVYAGFFFGKVRREWVEKRRLNATNTTAIRYELSRFLSQDHVTENDLPRLGLVRLRKSAFQSKVWERILRRQWALCARQSQYARSGWIRGRTSVPDGWLFFSSKHWSAEEGIHTATSSGEERRTSYSVERILLAAILS